MDRVAVVGGGLAGLVAARHLADRDVAVTLYERTDRLGGRVGSEQRGEFTVDRGFQVLFTAYPAVRRELDLDALDLGTFRPGAVVCRPGERSILADPVRDPRALTATLFNRSTTLGDAWRALRLRLDLAGRSPEEILTHDERTIDEILRERGFSHSFREEIAAPLFGGITLDRSLSNAAFVFEYALKMLAEGRAGVPRAGMQAIPEQLAARAETAGVEFRRGVAVDAVDAVEPGGEPGVEAGGEAGDETGDGVTLETSVATETFDGAVVATDPATARELTGVASIPTEARGCTTQHFALPATQDLQTDRRLVLNAADARPNHVAVLSEVADGYAPDGQQLLSATFLGVPDADDDALATVVRESLSSWFPENSFADLDLVATHRLPDAQLVQPPGFRSGLPAPDAPEGPVVLAGDYTRWSSIQGALESGRRAVETLLGSA